MPSNDRTSVVIPQTTITNACPASSDNTSRVKYNPSPVATNHWPARRPYGMSVTIHPAQRVSITATRLPTTQGSGQLTSAAI